MPRSFYVVGPTASGKHQAALLAAGKLGAEIVSVDSMKVYRGLDIGTAKPSPEERRRIPHHLIDVAEPEESYSAGRFVREACATAARIGTALFTGGTFLYYKAYVHGMFQGAPADPALRRNLEELAAREGSRHLHDRLSRLDPGAARRLHPNDSKRLIRALEVVESTGRPISQLQSQWTTFAGPVRAVALVRSRDELRRRIESRVDRMIREGLYEEARALLGRSLSREVKTAIGYREATQCLQGSLDQERAREEILRRTWLLCRKQLAWIRSLKELSVLDVTGIEDPEAVASLALGLLEDRPGRRS